MRKLDFTRRKKISIKISEQESLKKIVVYFFERESRQKSARHYEDE